MATSYGSSPRDNDKSCAKSNSRKTFSYEPTCNKKCNEPSIKPCSKTSSSVNFVPKENVDKREKYLTAKYGVHQMAFIKKRLVVEMWLFDELSRLYCTEVSMVILVNVIQICMKKYISQFWRIHV